MFLKRLFRNSIIFCFRLSHSLYKRLEDVVFKLDKYITKKEWNKPEKPHNVKEKLSIAFESTDAFENEFVKYMEYALQINPEHKKYRELLYYNFALRYFVAYYESRFDAIPLQVFNECRMTLDHFMRFFIDENDKNNNWNKALSHIRRGVLDILKLNCFWLQEFILREHKYVPRKALDFVLDGEYIKIFSELQTSAETALWEAKRKETEICSDSETNINVTKNFVEAFLAYLRWDEYQRKNAGKITRAVAKYRINIAFRFIGIAAIIKVAYDQFGNAIKEFISIFFN